MKLHYLLAVVGSVVLLTACNEDKSATPAAPVTEQAAPATTAPATTAPATTAPATTATNSKQANTSAQSLPVTYKGTISGYDYKSFSFEGKKGQKALITIKSQGHADAFLYGYDDFISGEPYTLPETTTYEVRVAQPRNSARKDEKSSYELTIQLIE
ncbi:hypothetical protein [Pelistega europaea]|uniref:hypothetical protein n=1 Tax=Pelistega europaea TaxID=106147 RepID=UPI001C12948F|nr:hypothetical protein [Pelistega europaea]